MAIRGRTPTPPEICVGRVQFLRRAERDGTFAQVFDMLNPAA